MKVTGKMDTDKLINLAQMIWTTNKYATRLICENGLEVKSRPLKSNLDKIMNFLKEQGVTVIDYTGQKFNEGMNVDIIDTIKSDVDEDIIKETIEPTIIYNGNIIKRARVIKEINRSCNE